MKGYATRQQAMAALAAIGKSEQAIGWSVKTASITESRDGGFHVEMHYHDRPSRNFYPTPRVAS